MKIPRKKTIHSEISGKDIPKYEEFFKMFERYIYKTPNRDELKILITHGIRDQTKYLLDSIDEGYCPKKYEALKYIPARVIVSNFYIYSTHYDNFVKMVKNTRKASIK